MIKKKTTFVLGAGASMAYGFPSGKTLKALIWKRLAKEPSNDWRKPTFPEYFYMATGCNHVDIGQRNEFDIKVQEFCKNLIISPDETIDYFLEHVGDNDDDKKNYRMIGRLAIADVLLEREQENCLFKDWMEYNSREKVHEQEYFLKKRTKIQPDDKHWYQFLFNQMCRECPSIDNFPDNSISVITFNYDRSFEYYFLRALMAKYKVDVQKAAEIINGFDIVHVYGQLGELPELIPQSETERKQKAVSYTALSETDIDKFVSLKNAANGIRLIWDNQEETKNTKAAKDLINKSNNQVVFLGFGYDPTNLERIMPQKEINPRSYIRGYGTIYGLSEQRLQDLNSKYKLKYSDGPAGITHGWFGRDIGGHRTNDFKDCKIYDFLYNSVELLR
jgi:hypothetical protein